jgi:peptide/nickel transport system permease protein
MTASPDHPSAPCAPPASGRLVAFVAGITFLGLLLVTFIIARVVPIDPVLSILGERATDAQIAAGARQAGPGLPMWKQFGIYVWQALQGDLGTSIRTVNRR